MSRQHSSTTRSHKPSAFPGAYRPRCAPRSTIAAEDLRTVREPLAWKLGTPHRAAPEAVRTLLARAERGPTATGWAPPSWLLPHQVSAAKRIAAILHRFGGALLADAVGMGKTFVALAVATRYRSVSVLVPASLLTQWRRVAARVGVPVTCVSHESLSRGVRVPPAELIVVDEAHRFRNPETNRYDRCARDVGAAHVLLVTATPVVNRLRDLEHLLRLFLPDHGLACLGVPSLEAAVAAADGPALARAVSRLTVARPPSAVRLGGLTFPSVADGEVACEPSVEPAVAATLLGALDALELPGVGADGARHLLRLHLVLRLASSAAALRETLRRHLAYLDRALACGGATPPSRTAMRQILGAGDELQFELDGTLEGRQLAAPPADALTRERQRVLDLLGAVPGNGHRSPKALRLEALLSRRGSGRTIVFTSAAATALELARRLGWRRVGVVAAGRARVASGAMGIDAVLDAFAPRARRAPDPGPRGLLQVLIATDLVSEGLDLQDADTIVHYDLPWTPLRLAQRLGRIARLGSEYDRAHVAWFAPPKDHERRIDLCRRLAEKARHQMTATVPVTSAIGRARIVNRALEERERLCAAAADIAVPRTTGSPWLAVVRGPPVFAAAVGWRIGRGEVSELLVVAGIPPTAITDCGAVAAWVDRLAGAAPSDRSIPPALRAVLFHLLRTRLRFASRGPAHASALRLRRAVLREGWEAGKRRDVRRVRLLDRVLDALAAGCAVGAERELSAILEDGGRPALLHEWLCRQPRRWPAEPDVRVLALLAGDGTVAA